MHPIVQEKLPEVRKLCERYQVKRLELFGSAATDRFDPARSDVDFFVDFDDPPDERLGDQYFGLLEELEQLFGRGVDLVETVAIENPYFLEVANRTRMTVYAA